MKQNIPAQLEGEGEASLVLVKLPDCPKPDVAVFVDRRHALACCAQGGARTCPYFVDLSKTDGQDYVGCAGLGANPKSMVRDLPAKVQALLAELYAESSAIGAWVREQLSTIEVNNILTRVATDEPEENHEPELKLLEVMVIPERVWRIATAAHLLERLGHRSMHDPVDPDTIISTYLAILKSES